MRQMLTPDSPEIAILKRKADAQHAIEDLFLHDLRRLRREGPTDVCYGICSHLIYGFGFPLKLTGILKTWPKYSGIRVYPVGGPDEYFNNHDLWSNPLRHEALAYAIQYTRNKIKQRRRSSALSNHQLSI